MVSILVEQHSDVIFFFIGNLIWSDQSGIYLVWDEKFIS